MILVNRSMYNINGSIYIDDNRKKIMFSDYNLIRVELKTKREGLRKNNEWKMVEY